MADLAPPEVHTEDPGAHELGQPFNTFSFEDFG